MSEEKQIKLRTKKQDYEVAGCTVRKVRNHERIGYVLTDKTTGDHFWLIRVASNPDYMVPAKPGKTELAVVNGIKIFLDDQLDPLSKVNAVEDVKN